MRQFLFRKKFWGPLLIVDWCHHLYGSHTALISLAGFAQSSHMTNWVFPIWHHWIPGNFPFHFSNGVTSSLLIDVHLCFVLGERVIISKYFIDSRIISFINVMLRSDQNLTAEQLNRRITYLSIFHSLASKLVSAPAPSSPQPSHLSLTPLHPSWSE